MYEMRYLTESNYQVLDDFIANPGIPSSSHQEVEPSEQKIDEQNLYQEYEHEHDLLRTVYGRPPASKPAVPKHPIADLALPALVKEAQSVRAIFA